MESVQQDRPLRCPCTARGETPSTCIDVVRGDGSDVNLEYRTSTESFAGEVNSKVRQDRFPPSVLIGHSTVAIDKRTTMARNVESGDI
jgi:hypothetical protein